jgi:phosphatidylserine/phosphatidylglycerophosphate/cardiolipin synthase-like enzyme
MHDKFLLIEAPDQRQVVFGSFNWSEPSRRFNREIGAIARDPALYAAFAARWQVLRAHAEAPQAASP